MMNEIFMKLLFALSDMGNIRDLRFYNKSGYGSIDVEIGGKLYSLSIRNAEDEKDD